MKAKELRKKYRIIITGVMMAALLAGTTACSTQASDTSSPANAAESSTVAADAAEEATAAEAKSGPSKDEITTTETIENSEDGGHAIIADAEEQTYANTTVTKTGDSDSTARTEAMPLLRTQKSRHMQIRQSQRPAIQTPRLRR